MITLTNTTPCLTPSGVLAATAPRFHPGDLVVIAGCQPLVCVVLEETARGYVRLSQAACPEACLLVKLSEVQHLSTWLLTEVSAGKRSHAVGAGGSA